MPVIPEDFRDLLSSSIATLATVGPSGFPQLTNVAFIYDATDDLIKLSLNDTRQKTKNMRRNPRVTLFILDPANSYRTLEVRANAGLSPDPDFSFAAIAGTKYGQDFRAHDLPGETRSVVTLRPHRIVATDMTR